MAIYVVAGSTHSYERWLRGPGTAYAETVHLLKDARQIRIMWPGDRLMLLADWRDRADWRAIYNTMLATGRRGER